MSLIPRGSFEAASDFTTAEVIGTDGSRTQAAVDARIGPVAAAIIAAEPTITQAAADAIAEKVLDLDLVESDDVRLWQIANSETIVAAIVDSKRRASWIAVDKNGLLPPHSQQAVGLVIEPKLAGMGLSFAVSDGVRLGDMGLTLEGRWWQRSVDTMGGRLRTRSPIAAHGDSLTHGQLGNGVTWPGVTSADLGVPAWSTAVSGEASADVALRMGAYSPLVQFPVNVMPDTTDPVTVTLSGVPTDGAFRIGSSYEKVGKFRGTLGGIPGILTHVQTGAAANTWTWTRDAGGDFTGPVQIPNSGIRFVSTGAREHRTDIAIIWAGRNNPQQAQIVRDVGAMTSYVGGVPARYLVLGVTTTALEGTNATGSNLAFRNAILATNTALAAAYGDRFFDVRRWLIDSGIAAIGSTPTAADTTAINSDTIPPQLLSDNTHLNPLAYHALGIKIASVLRALGFYPA